MVNSDTRSVERVAVDIGRRKIAVDHSLEQQVMLRLCKSSLLGRELDYSSVPKKDTYLKQVLCLMYCSLDCDSRMSETAFLPASDHNIEPL